MILRDLVRRWGFKRIQDRKRVKLIQIEARRIKRLRKGFTTNKIWSCNFQKTTQNTNRHNSTKSTIQSPIPINNPKTSWAPCAKSKITTNNPSANQSLYKILHLYKNGATNGTLWVLGWKNRCQGYLHVQTMSYKLREGSWSSVRWYTTSRKGWCIMRRRFITRRGRCICKKWLR